LHAIEGELQFHGGLALETDSLAQAGERGDCIEEPAGAGGEG